MPWFTSEETFPALGNAGIQTEAKTRCPDCPVRPGYYVGLLDVLPCEKCSGTGLVTAQKPLPEKPVMLGLFELPGYKECLYTVPYQGLVTVLAKDIPEGNFDGAVPDPRPGDLHFLYGKFYRHGNIIEHPRTGLRFKIT